MYFMSLNSAMRQEEDFPESLGRRDKMLKAGNRVSSLLERQVMLGRFREAFCVC